MDHRVEHVEISMNWNYTFRFTPFLPRRTTRAHFPAIFKTPKSDEATMTSAAAVCLSRPPFSIILGATIDIIIRYTSYVASAFDSSKFGKKSRRNELVLGRHRGGMVGRYSIMLVFIAADEATTSWDNSKHLQQLNSVNCKYDIVSLSY